MAMVINIRLRDALISPLDLLVSGSWDHAVLSHANVADADARQNGECSEVRTVFLAADM